MSTMTASLPAATKPPTKTPRTPPGVTPDYLVPTMDDTPVEEPAIYRSLYVLDSLDAQAAAGAGGNNLRVLAAPIDPFDDATVGEEVQRSPALGVLTVHEQGWVQSGLALGNLLQSVCLAPGEVTRVAVIDWRRKTTGSSTEAVDQGDTVSADTTQDRAASDVQKSVAQDAQSGTSSTMGTSASVQSGVTIGTLLVTGTVSAAATTTGALTAQFSAGGRNLEASSTAQISQRTAEKAQHLRSRRQSVVREVSEQESESLSSRVLANYNRRHSLNVEYFEVLQLYRIETKLAGWDRCIFIPMQPLDFTKPAVRSRHKADLLSIFKQWGALDLAAKLTNSQEDQQAADAIKTQFDGKIKELRDAAELERVYREYYATWKQLDDTYRKETGKPMAQMNPKRDEQHITRLTDQGNKYTAIQRKYPNILITVQQMTDGSGRINRIEAAIEELLFEKAKLSLTLGEILNNNQIFLSQQIWLRMDSYRIYRALKPYQIGGKPLSSVVEPVPVGVFGNFLAFRWGFGRDKAGQSERAQFEKEYLSQDGEAVQVTRVVGLPTSGVFAEAVLGRGEAAEEIDVTRFGKWKDNQPPILPPGIAELSSRDRAKDMDLSAQDFAQSLATLRSKNLKDVSHIDKILSAVTNGEMFRNMGGLGEAVSLADKVSAISGSGATRAGDRAGELHAKILDTFVDVLNSDVGKAAVAEFMLPGAGAALLSGGGGSKSNGKSSATKTDKTTADKTDKTSADKEDKGKTPEKEEFNKDDFS